MYPLFYGISCGVCPAIIIAREIVIGFGDTEQEYLVRRCVAWRRTVIRVRMRWNVGRYDFGLFFRCKSRVDEVVARKACTNCIIRCCIPIEPGTNRTLFPGDGALRCVVFLSIQHLFADDEELPVTLSIKNTPCNRFFTVCSVVILFVSTECDGFTNRNGNAGCFIALIANGTSNSTSSAIISITVRLYGLCVAGDCCRGCETGYPLAC